MILFCFWVVFVSILRETVFNPIFDRILTYFWHCSNLLSTRYKNRWLGSTRTRLLCQTSVNSNSHSNTKFFSFRTSVSRPSYLTSHLNIFSEASWRWTKDWSSMNQTLVCLYMHNYTLILRPLLSGIMDVYVLRFLILITDKFVPISGKLFPISGKMFPIPSKPSWLGEISWSKLELVCQSIGYNFEEQKGWKQVLVLGWFLQLCHRYLLQASVFFLLLSTVLVFILWASYDYFRVCF